VLAICQHNLDTLVGGTLRHVVTGTIRHLVPAALRAGHLHMHTRQDPALMHKHLG
jgi:hypothetical protein